MGSSGGAVDHPIFDRKVRRVEQTMFVFFTDAAFPRISAVFWIMIREMLGDLVRKIGAEYRDILRFFLI